MQLPARIQILRVGATEHVEARRTAAAVLTPFRQPVRVLKGRETVRDLDVVRMLVGEGVERGTAQRELLLPVVPHHLGVVHALPAEIGCAVFERSTREKATGGLARDVTLVRELERVPRQVRPGLGEGKSQRCLFRDVRIGLELRSGEAVAKERGADVNGGRVRRCPGRDRLEVHGQKLRQVNGLPHDVVVERRKAGQRAQRRRADPERGIGHTERLRPHPVRLHHVAAHLVAHGGRVRLRPLLGLLATR